MLLSFGRDRTIHSAGVVSHDSAISERWPTNKLGAQQMPNETLK
jgi:hypothetical protein